MVVAQVGETLPEQWRRSRSGRSGGRRTNIFAKKKKDVCLIGRLLVVFARLVKRGLFVMEDPEHGKKGGGISWISTSSGTPLSKGREEASSVLRQFHLRSGAASSLSFPSFQRHASIE